MSGSEGGDMRETPGSCQHFVSLDPHVPGRVGCRRAPWRYGCCSLLSLTLGSPRVVKSSRGTDDWACCSSPAMSSPNQELCCCVFLASIVAQPSDSSALFVSGCSGPAAT